MRVFMTATLALGSFCFFETQAAKATSLNTASPFFHLARGEHFSISGKFHGGIRHNDEEAEKHQHQGTERDSASDHLTSKNNHPPMMDRLHTLHEKKFMKGGDFDGHVTIKEKSGDFGVRISVEGEFHGKVVRGGKRPGDNHTGGNHVENNHQESSGNQGDNHNSGSTGNQTAENNSGSTSSQTASNKESSGNQATSSNTGSSGSQTEHSPGPSMTTPHTADQSRNRESRIHTLNTQHKTQDNLQYPHWTTYGGWGVVGGGELICATNSDGDIICY